MRLFLTSVLALALLATTASGQAPPAPSDSTTGEAVFAVSGRGWGHGVGLSQWGAYGQAKAGRTYEQILAILRDDGYDGWASIEHWGSPEAMLSGLRQLRPVLDRVNLKRP